LIRYSRKNNSLKD